MVGTHNSVLYVGRLNARDTRSRNGCHKSTPFISRRFLVRVSCKFETRFVHVTEMITCDWSLLIIFHFLTVGSCK